MASEQIKAAEVPEAMGDAEINSLRYLLDVDDYDPKMMKFASAILRHRDAQWQSTRLRGGVPEGWKLVPVEPTPEMVAAGMEALFNRGPVKKPWDDYVAEMFAAILGAAPQSPALGSGVSTVKAEFNGAIDFAIREGIGAAIFLEAWRHGDTSEWPEFAAMSAQAGKGGAA